MRHDNNMTFTLSDGIKRSFGSYRNHIALVPVKWGGGAYASMDGEGEGAIVTSILVQPPPGERCVERRDLGTLRVERLQQTMLDAPVSSLVNRYHGLTQAAQIHGRLALALGLQISLQPDDVFAPPLSIPFEWRPYASFWLIHTPGADPVDEIQIEIQMLLGSPVPEFKESACR
jgi:hypothetical protein